MYDEEEDVPDESYAIPFGEANLTREGSDATIVALGRMVQFSNTAADNLAADGISCSVIDPRTISPMDEDTILESVEESGRLVVVDEATPRCSMPTDIAALVADKGFGTLKAPIKMVTAPHIAVPFAPELEDAYVPSPEKIEAAVREVVAYKK
jgi:pyruvate dehydrogenase E1 component beta subunit